jgi:DNA invertase Pin-like site-specific DNA recombinase
MSERTESAAIKSDPEAALAAAARRYEAAVTAMEEAKQERAAAARHAKDAGVPVYAMVRAAGVSRQQLYKILEK